MQITLNSKPKQLPHSISVADLITRENIPAPGTAVAVNGSLVRKDNWTERMLCEGDDVIIISAAYGG